MIPASIIGFFTKKAVFGALGAVWKGFCDFIATPIGAALVAGLLMYNVGKIHEYRVLNAKWEEKWAAEERNAEAARKQRDADIAAQMKSEADKRLAVIAARKTELEGMVKKYEDEEARQRAVGNTGRQCLTDSTDARWLSDAQQRRSKANAKPETRGRYTFRLRALGR